MRIPPGIGIFFLLISGQTWAVSADATAAYERIRKACVAHDGAAIWNMANAQFQAEVDQRAKQIAHAFGPKDLKMAYPRFKGTPAQFDGQALWNESVHSENKLENPCWGADKWKIIDEADKGNAYSVALLSTARK